MYVLKVFNNNIVMTVNDQGEEVIVTGKGIGFQKKSGIQSRKKKLKNGLLSKIAFQKMH